MDDTTENSFSVDERREWMSLLAKSSEGAIKQYLKDIVPPPSFSYLRQPEVGSVMVRGKTSGTGAAFNLGEMTVTRCVLRLSTGEVGHAYVQGRRKSCAEAAAMVDALMQSKYANAVRLTVLNPLQADKQRQNTDRAQKAAATKVDFFTMARGEDT